jgi:hypothetical protein
VRRRRGRRAPKKKISIEIRPEERGAKAIPLARNFDRTCYPIDIGFVILKCKTRRLSEHASNKGLSQAGLGLLDGQVAFEKRQPLGQTDVFGFFESVHACLAVWRIVCLNLFSEL